MKYILSFILVLLMIKSYSQELYVFTEPASNMAANSIGIRTNNNLMKDIDTKKINYHLVPEVMLGISKKIMIHLDAFLSNRNGGFVTEGGSVYAKYRFHSIDEVHKHFRMAAYVRYSFNNSDIHQTAIDLYGHNSGVETGVIATKLINKVALSSAASLLHATDNGKEKFNYGDKNRNAINYSFSAGKLMLPKEYTSYKQVNVNLMVEFLGQTNLSDANNYLDVAPAVQFIFNSRLRVDAGYRYPLVTNLTRTAPQGVVLKLEYNFFNVLKQKD